LRFIGYKNNQKEYYNIEAYDTRLNSDDAQILPLSQSTNRFIETLKNTYNYSSRDLYLSKLYIGNIWLHSIFYATRCNSSIINKLSKVKRYNIINKSLLTAKQEISFSKIRTGYIYL
jgi:hypothetical protein